MSKELKDLLLNLHTRGRRYSYYPSLPDWNGDYDKVEIIKSLSLKKINLYIHIPFCASLCTFCGCNIKVTRSSDQFQSYIEKILEEWKLYKEEYPQIELASIYLGGGTPTYLTLDNIKYLIDNILEGTKCDQTFFGTIETDPRLLQVEKLKYLSSVGFNALSIGVQDTNTETLANVNRHQSFDQVRALVNCARENGFSEINLDLIYGLPFQTLKSFEKSLNDVLTLKPERIANYPLAKVPWQMDLQNALGIYRPLGTEDMYDLYIHSDEILKSNGHRLLGMGHYSNQEKHYNRNITGYTSALNAPLIALGTSSISNTDQYLFQNDKILEKYHQYPNRIVTSHKKKKNEVILESIFQDINCNGTFSLLDLHNHHTVNSNEQKSETLIRHMNMLIEYKILEHKNDVYKITELGKHFNKTICQSIEKAHSSPQN
ncbi:oxygen-independent coproporphyrinogen III oxidase [Halobacteriovorax marinus SJ]|uniref:Coproporphyrinogen-III oxidase n=1 Tax=Halobacteriovorax marinus (strain ATCC BAA-682 / DSM 15412 / SJ) TaxID=862908 RepID=E1X327_HALMS|nr:coproporphyrinogen-III oxidase family protein [Halobacteriovorax marinus]CBW26857.1 oxygen-independent coproporphyrinogen III oxidase [Halobacteriovorax marinus SJ]